MAKRKEQCPKPPMGQMCHECLGNYTCRFGKVRPAAPAPAKVAQGGKAS